MSIEHTGAAQGAQAHSAAQAGNDATRAAQIAAEHHVRYLPEEHVFRVNIGGVPTDLSPLEAVSLVLQQRYITMSNITAEKTLEMQDQVDAISGANQWLDSLRRQDGNGHTVTTPQGESGHILAWMDRNGLETDGLSDRPNAEQAKKMESAVSNYVDKLSSTNDLKMLSLKTSVNKAQEALSASDALLQNLKQLMQLINSNMAR